MSRAPALGTDLRRMQKQQFPCWRPGVAASAVSLVTAAWGIKCSAKPLAGTSLLGILGYIQALHLARSNQGWINLTTWHLHSINHPNNGMPQEVN